MLHNLTGLTGGSDLGRCPFRVSCRWEEFLLPRYHTEAREDRTMDVIAGQWELAVMTLANWAAVSAGPLVFRGGEGLVRCPVCKRSIPYSSERVEGSGVVSCINARCLGATHLVPVTASISKTAMTEAFNACRRLAGGVRCYPLLRGMQVELQAPVLHCTGTIAQLLVYFILSCLPADVAAKSRQVISAITSKGKVESLYLREFRELVAFAVTCTPIFTEDLDSALFGMLQVVQLLNAAWRGSLSDPEAADRSGAAAIARLAAMVLGPLYLNLKPLDPVKKDAKVTTLYMHSAIAHLRHRVAVERTGPGFVTDDNMEGHLRGLGRYVYNNANNASQAALFADLVAVRDASMGFVTARSHPSSLIYTKEMRICKCWTSLSDGGDEDFSAISKVVQGDPELSLGDGCTENLLVVTLPLHEQADCNGERRTTSDGHRQLGKKEALRRGLRFRQRVVNACHCGKLGGKSSRLVEHLLQKRARAAAAEKGGVPATGSDSSANSLAERQRERAASGPAAAASSGESDGQRGDMSAGDAAVTTNDGSSDGQTDNAVAPEKPQVTARSRVVAAVAAHVPPRCVLRLVLPAATVSAAGGRWSEEESVAPSSMREREAELRKQVTVMRLLLHRTRSYDFTSWAVAEGVARIDFVEAVRLVLGRLDAVHTRMVLSSRR